MVESSPRRCGREGSLTTATMSARSMPSTPASVARKSAAKVPIPHARGGYVETIAVRSVLIAQRRARGHERRLHSLELLHAASGGESPSERLVRRCAQPFEDSPQALSHDVAPTRDSPKQQAAGSCGSRKHGDAAHSVADGSTTGC